MMLRGLFEGFNTWPLGKNCPNHGNEFTPNDHIMTPLVLLRGAIHSVRTHGRKGRGGMIAAYITVQGGREVTSASGRTENKFL